jgi:hypothetical protein
MRKLVFRRQTQLELSEATSWYADRNPVIAANFVKSFALALTSSLKIHCNIRTWETASAAPPSGAFHMVFCLLLQMMRL